MDFDFTIKGRLHHIGEVQSFGDNGFQKRIIVIETAQKFNNLVPVELLKKNVDKVLGCGKGQEVEVSGWLGGREYKGRYYPQLVGGDVVRITDNMALPFD